MMMKWIKHFEGYLDEFYTIVSYDFFYEKSKASLELTKKDMDFFKKLLPDFSIHDINITPNTPKFCKIFYGYPPMRSPSYTLTIKVVKSDDDWWYLHISAQLFPGEKRNQVCYKCDNYEGVEELFKNLIKPNKNLFNYLKKLS